MNYFDIRTEKHCGERFYVDRGKVGKYLAIRREGSSARVSFDGEFQYVPTLAEAREPRTESDDGFTRYLLGVWEQEKMHLDSCSPKVDDHFSVPNELMTVAQTYTDERLSFRFTWELRDQTFENSLGFSRQKVELARVVRVDVKEDYGEKPVHLRKIMDNPSAETLAQEIDALLTGLAELKSARRPSLRDSCAVVLDPTVASVFVHEVVGHWAEQFQSRSHWKSFHLHQLGPQSMTVIEDAESSDRRYLAQWDDEGIELKTYSLIEEGRVCSPIASLETAYKLGVKPHGRGRAQDFRYPVVSRMANVKLLEGTYSFSDLLERVGNGYYVVGSLGGLNNQDLYQIQTQHAYRISNGTLAERVSGPLLMGAVSASLRHICGLGDKSHWTPDGGCFGRGQFLEVSGRAAPYMAIDDIMLYF